MAVLAAGGRGLYESCIGWPPRSGDPSRGNRVFTDVRKLRAFMAIVEEGSFTGAAIRLNTAQPWVSNQLRQLEDMLGLPLIERSKGKLVRITAQGQELYRIAQRLFAALAEANEQIRELGHAERGRLVLGVDPITLYMPERNQLLARFMAQETGINLQMVSRTPNELFEGLRNGELDLILTSAPFPDADRFEMLPLYEYDLCLLVPRSAADAYQQTAHGSLENAEIMVLQEKYHTGIFPWLRKELAPWHVRWRDCPELAFPALMRYATQMGVATLVPDFSATMPEVRDEMEVRAIHEPRLKVRWGLMRREGEHRKAADRLWRMAQAQRLPATGKSPAI